MKTDVALYWFSGSGNTLFIAKTIAECLGGLNYHVRLVPLEKVDPASIEVSNVAIGLVVPVAGQGTFPIVWEFVENLPDADGTEIFLVDTMGMYSGGILGPMKKILKKKGYVTKAAIELLMPNTFQKRKVNAENDRKRVERAVEKVKTFCQRLDEGKGAWFDIPLYSDFLSIMYRKRSLVRKWVGLFPITRDASCSKCGLCVRLCPEHCITQDAEGNLLTDATRCTLCQRCFEYCPQNAITIGKQKLQRNGRIPLREFMRYLNQ
jgi:ferredoxin